jgi:Fe-S cluster biogenesis protein NfuA
VDAVVGAAYVVADDTMLGRADESTQPATAVAARAVTSASAETGMRGRAGDVAMAGDRRLRPASMRTHPPGPAARVTRLDTMRTQVEETIEVIRPALQADGGDIVLRDVDEVTGVVSVTLTGACGTCPASTQTLKAGIERIMRDRVDGVTEVINVE